MKVDGIRDERRVEWWGGGDLESSKSGVMGGYE